MIQLDSELVNLKLLGLVLGAVMQIFKLILSKIFTNFKCFSILFVL